ncbi:hypothetical protein OC25_08855 [Pedobacter kyungheensis]|uniref:DUF3805 domain-containing protein n=1 Tax=Pedobacter kyungheensis TaxID=1069985 RepID=A0A0C1DB89_9SPHI|nr:DUF3805 domain-containing protein [Pedobacter kyungheensis]KIA94761.1 hypothetical protein OC25_08855 [Pedobacter kyungheensis]
MENNYISRDGSFSFALADGWAEYDDDDEATHAFWHATESPWTGNLRITAFQWPDTTNPDVDRAAEYITSEIEENEGSQSIRLGNYNCAHYQKESVQDGEGHITYYWITGKHNDIFICTFTIDSAQKFLPVHETELTAVQNMIASIQII